jgi:SAM-dependent methyltransferase
MTIEHDAERSFDAVCPLCGKTGWAPVVDRDGYHIGRCTSCTMLYVCPMPSEEALKAHYLSPEYFQGSGAQGYRDYASMRKALIPHFRRRLHLIGGMAAQRGRLLDVGCAAGYFLEVAQAEGWTVQGVEPALEMGQETAARLHVPVALSLDALAARSLDVVTLWEVIEHIPCPVEELRLLRHRLRPGGLLMLSTPNAGHWQALREPDSWNGFRPPSHLVFFTKETLEDALRLAGFERISIRGVAPLPPFPGWLRRLSAPLQQGLADGHARFWPLALLSWRVIRLVGWGWQKLVRSGDDIFATLEASAFCPK